MVLAEEKSYARQPSRRPKKRKIAKRQQRQKLVVYLQLTAIILSCFGIGIFYIYKHHQVTALGYRVEENRQRVAVLQRDIKQLELEAAELQCPERVEEIAINKIGMDKPENVLLAALPFAKDNTVEQKQNALLGQEKEKGSGFLVALKQFMGRAEASPQ
ncbi:MAG: hypothetical protein ACOX2E_09995 [Syntrophaceticus sp.]